MSYSKYNALTNLPRALCAFGVKWRLEKGWSCKWELIAAQSMLTRMFFLRNGIIAMPAPRMAAADALGAEVESFQRAMHFDRFDHVGGTRGVVPAAVR